MHRKRNFTPPSPQAQLLGGPKAEIFHARTQEDTPVLLSKSIPVAVLRHFSIFFDDCFPPVGKACVNREGCDGKGRVVIYGGVSGAFTVILEWMLATLKNPHFRIERLKFAKYARLHEAATLLGIPQVQNDMAIRMELMSKNQVPIEDVRTVYANFPADSLPRAIVIRSIGDAVFERRLRRWDLYKEFKLECIEYDYDIYYYVEQKKDELGAKERAERAAKAEKRHRHKKSSSANSSERAAEEPQVVTKTVKGVVTRKGRNGKPTYVRVGLSDFGVSNDQFSARH